MSSIWQKLVAAFAFVLLAGGSLCACSAPPPPVKPHRFWACGSVESVDPHSHAFAAMFLALNDLKWKITNRDYEKKKISAYACYATDPKRCANMNFQAMKSGQVLVSQMKGRPVPGNLRDDLERWMLAFNQSYGKFSCYTDDALRKAVEPFGFAF